MKSIGRRNRLVTLQTATLTSDGQGGQTAAWATLATEWAAEMPLNASEAQRAAQLTGVLTTAWVLPFREDVSVKDRMVYGSRTVEIQSLQDETGRREELKLMCVEVAA